MKHKGWTWKKAYDKLKCFFNKGCIRDEWCIVGVYQSSLALYINAFHGCFL